MGISANRLSQGHRRNPVQGLPINETVTPVNPVAPVAPVSGGFSTAPPPPFVFADKPKVAAPYVTPTRAPDSRSGASPAFASQQAQGFNPVQSFLASPPALGSQTPWVNNMTLPPEAMTPIAPAPVQAAPPVQQEEEAKQARFREALKGAFMQNMNNI